MARFSAVPSVPQGGLTDWQAVLFSSLKENVELLIGARGEADLASRAIVKGQITVNEASQQNLLRVTAEGKGYTISGQNVADLDDVGKLIKDVQELANDLVYTRNVLNTLIRQLKG
jgi:hypothetical protein